MLQAYYITGICRETVKLKTQARTTKVLLSLVASMTLGAVVLMALDTQKLSGGAFSLASYTHLNPVGDVASRLGTTKTMSWNGVQVYYSRTDSGNIEQLANSAGLSTADADFHFVIGNGSGLVDGTIEATEKWRRQRPCLGGQYQQNSVTKIRICIIADGIKAVPTDSQTKRTAALVGLLARKFDISSTKITYPVNWQL